MKKTIISIFLISFVLLSHAHVGLLYPEGGESFTEGQEVVIEWEILVAHDTQNWDLFLSQDDGITWEPISLDIPPENLSYTWMVPGINTDQAKIRIVMDNTGIDYDDESDNFSISSTIGIRSIVDPETDLNIYPNPASDHVYLTSSKQIENPLIRVIDMQGRVVFSHETQIISVNDPFEIKLYALKPGLYSFQINTASTILSRKIVVQ